MSIFFLYSKSVTTGDTFLEYKIYVTKQQISKLSHNKYIEQVYWFTKLNEKKCHQW